MTGWRDCIALASVFTSHGPALIVGGGTALISKNAYGFRVILRTLVKPPPHEQFCSLTFSNGSGANQQDFRNNKNGQICHFKTRSAVRIDVGG
jgi:ribosomal protein RSM22 (predicted rRNA methylase)